MEDIVGMKMHKLLDNSIECDKMTKRKQITVEDMKKEKIIKCPKCLVDMVKLTNGRYIIDKCPKCEGIFLDKDEIDVAHKIGFMTYVLDYFRKDKHKK